MEEIGLLKSEIEAHPENAEKLYAYGFLYSETKFDVDKYPFYGMWNVECICPEGEKNGYLFTHRKARHYIKKADNKTFALIGHALNPFTKEHDELLILKKLADCTNNDDFLNYFNQLTGVFTLLVFENSAMRIYGDPTGMQTTYYGVLNGNRYVSSHIKLLGDVLNLEDSAYIKRLVNYKYYPLLGAALPGDYTNYDEFKRVIPNNFVELTNSVRIERFYEPERLQKSIDDIANEVYEILKTTLDLIAKKWDRPAISLTGGCDSKTTLACANGSYEKFSYFSYVSSEEENVDAEAARKICNKIGIPHTVYKISDDDSDFDALSCHNAILYRNTGSTRKINQNDLRKRCYFSSISDFDVEVKSWCSEIGRAYFSKRFNGRKKFGKITPRKCTTLYKFFLHDRRLVRDTDKIFKEYISRYMNAAKYTESSIEWQEKFFWEFRMSAWNGNVITGEHKYSFDITIPYNNRMLLQLLLSVPIEERISDELYRKTRMLANDKIEKINVSVTNVKHTNKRAKMENLYYMLHSKFPF